MIYYVACARWTGVVSFTTVAERHSRLELNMVNVLSMFTTHFPPLCSLAVLRMNIADPKSAGENAPAYVRFQFVFGFGRSGALEQNRSDDECRQQETPLGKNTSCSIRTIGGRIGGGFNFPKWKCRQGEGEAAVGAAS